MQTEMIERNGRKVAIIRFPEGSELRRSGQSEETLYQIVSGLPPDCDLVINCNEIYFVDSFAIGEILASYVLFHKRDRRFILAAVSPKLLHSFQMTRLDTVFKIMPDEETALSALLGD